MIEEILLSLQDKLRSGDYLDNDTALDKLSSLLQSQSSDKQRKIIANTLPIALCSKHENIQKKTVQVVINYPTILKDILPSLTISQDTTVRFWAYFISIELGFIKQDALLDLLNSHESDEIRRIAIDALAKSLINRLLLLFLIKLMTLAG